MKIIFGIENFVLKFDYNLSITIKFSVLYIANYGLECNKMLQCIVFYNELLIFHDLEVVLDTLAPLHIPVEHERWNALSYSISLIKLRGIFFLIFLSQHAFQIHPQNHFF